MKFQINLDFIFFDTIFNNVLRNALKPREDKGDREGIPYTHPIP